MNPRTVPYHKLTKRIHQRMLDQAGALSVYHNGLPVLTEYQQKWLKFMRGEK